MSDVFDSPSESEFEDESATPGGEAGSKESKNEGRSLENVRGELVRKYDKLEAQITALNESIQKLAGAVVKTQEPVKTPTTPAAPAQRPIISPYGAPNPGIDEYTDEQLQQALASGQLNQYQARVIEAALSERRIERKTREMFEQREKAMAQSAARNEADEAALASFPALRDPNSEFSRRVNAALEQQRQRFGEFPTDKFDVANRIARHMGVEVSRLATPGYIGKPEGSETPPAKDDEVPGMDDETLTEIANNLRYAMPIRRNPETGRMERKKYNLKRIKERSKAYSESQHAFKAGRKIRGGSQ